MISTIESFAGVCEALDDGHVFGIPSLMSHKHLTAFIFHLINDDFLEKNGCDKTEI